MNITWKVSDGSRTHETEIPDDELLACNTYFEARFLIAEYITKDYTNKVSWSYSDNVNDKLRELGIVMPEAVQ